MNFKDFDDAYFLARIPTNKQRETMHELDRKWITQNLLTSKFSHQSSLLDIGCSDGKFLEPYHQRGYRICGIEPNRLQAKKASDAGTEIITEPSEVSDLGAVIIRGTLHHLPDFEETMHQIFEAFNKSTSDDDKFIFVLAEPNADSRIFQRFGKLPALEENPNFSSNYRVHSAERLQQYFEMYGAEVVLAYPYINTPYSNLPLDFLKYISMMYLGRYIKVPWFGNMFNMSVRFEGGHNLQLN
jgi:SAM-dependent methyltransferase